MLQSLSSAIDVDASIDTPRLHDHFVAVFAAAAGIVAANLDQLVWWDEGLALRKGFYEHIRAQANLLTLAGALDVDDLPLGTHIEWAHDDEYDSDDDGGDDPEDSDFDEDNQAEGEEGVEEQGEVDEEEDVLDEPEEEEAVLTDDEAGAGSDEDDG